MGGLCSPCPPAAAPTVALASPKGRDRVVRGSPSVGSELFGTFGRLPKETPKGATRTRGRRSAGESKWCWQDERLVRMSSRRSISQPKGFRNALSRTAVGFKYCRNAAETELQTWRHSGAAGVRCTGQRSAAPVHGGLEGFS